MRLQIAGVLVGLVCGLSPIRGHAKEADLTPCIGKWEGTAEDPWDPGPYAMKVNLTGGVLQCATVTYVGLCTSRWVDCTAGDDWVKATERLVDPGNCAEGTIEVRCESADKLHVRWQGGPGVMETTLHRVAGPAAATAEPTAPPSKSAPPSKAAPPDKSAPPSEAAPASDSAPPAPPQRAEESSCRVGGGQESWLWMLMVLAPRRRR